MGSVNALLLAQWYGAYYQEVVDSGWDEDLATAFQIGVWQFVYESKDELLNLTDVDLGKFRAEPQTLTGATDQANLWFTADDAGGGDGVPDWLQQGTLALTALISPLPPNQTPLYQDQVVVEPGPGPTPYIPLPSPLLVMLPLFGATFALSVLRRKSSQA